MLPAGCKVSYRLVGVDGVKSALARAQWMQQHSSALRALCKILASPNKVVLAGDSANGTIVRLQINLNNLDVGKYPVEIDREQVHVCLQVAS